MEKNKDCLKYLIGKRFQNSRSAIGLTQRQLADKLDLDPSTIAAIEIGKSYPSIPVLKYLMENYQVNPQWILFEKGQIFFSDSALRTIFPNLPNDPQIDIMIECLQVDGVYYAIMAEWIEIRERFKTQIEEFFFKNNREIPNGM